MKKNEKEFCNKLISALEAIEKQEAISTPHGSDYVKGMYECRRIARIALDIAKPYRHIEINNVNHE